MFDFARWLLSLRLALWKMAKLVFRLVSRTSEIQRICMGDPRLTNGSADLDSPHRRHPGARAHAPHRSDSSASVPPHSTEMTEAFWASLQQSSKLQIYRDRLQSGSCDAAAVANDIIAAKRIVGEDVRANVHACTVAIVRLSEFIERVRGLQRMEYSSANAQHEEMLNTLWRLLLPTTERVGGRITSEWGEIGFQGKDPATDFRGGGLLGLTQLLFFAENRGDVARAMLKDNRITESAKYPWSCCGINITAEMLRLLEARIVARRLYGAGSVDEAMDIFHEVYCDVFEYFHANYANSHPTDVMDFPPKFKETMKQVKDMITKTGAVSVGSGTTDGSSKKRD